MATIGAQAAPPTRTPAGEAFLLGVTQELHLAAEGLQQLSDEALALEANQEDAGFNLDNHAPDTEAFLQQLFNIQVPYWFLILRMNENNPVSVYVSSTN